MDQKIRNSEYLYITCKRCNKKIKIAKNKGACVWKTFNPDWISEFLLEHHNCSTEDIVLKFVGNI